MIGFLQMIRSISTSAGKPVMFFPLSFIIALSAIKDLFEDLKRNREDNKENNNKTLRSKNQQFDSTSWQSLRVGDIIKVFQPS